MRVFVPVIMFPGLGFKFHFPKDNVLMDDEGRYLVKYHCPECKTVYGYDRPCTCPVCGLDEEIGNPYKQDLMRMVPGLPHNPGVPTVGGS